MMLVTQLFLPAFSKTCLRVVCMLLNVRVTIVIQERVLFVLCSLGITYWYLIYTVRCFPEQIVKMQKETCH